jgi:hypothetical protein
VTLCAFGALLLLTLLLLLLRGPEEVHCALSAQGVTLNDYIRNPSPLKLYARLISPAMIQNASDEQEDGLICVRHTQLRWVEIRRAQCWPETNTILLYRPRYWQAMCLRCDQNNYGETVAFIQGKLPKKKRVKRKTK